ncbi:hypothetical protein [Desulfotruncus arcticus]|uniref:hypothetical protein n=1 Tax=Desulfotruncus arcticus TaxID=341036 RepID=UPI0013F4F965
MLSHFELPGFLPPYAVQLESQLDQLEEADLIIIAATAKEYRKPKERGNKILRFFLVRN